MARAAHALVALPLVAASLTTPQMLHAETVYEFATSCHEDELAECFNHVRDALDRVKAKGQGQAFCMPRSWGMMDSPFSEYPVSLLDHIRLALSAARFGKAEQSADSAISEVLAKIYPCD